MTSKLGNLQRRRCTVAERGADSTNTPNAQNHLFHLASGLGLPVSRRPTLLGNPRPLAVHRFHDLVLNLQWRDGNREVPDVLRADLPHAANGAPGIYLKVSASQRALDYLSDVLAK